MTVAGLKDLIVLVADLDAEVGVKALLPRATHLGFREIDFDVIRHVHRDNGVFQQAHELLRAQSRRYRYAIAICDHHGCGREELSRNEVEARVELNLRANGWDERAAAIVIEPELEAWIWGDWSAVVKCVGWTEGPVALKSWLRDRNFLRADQPKPIRPKEALHRALRQTNRRSSSALFADIAQTADSTSCIDEAFLKFSSPLQAWFAT